MTKKMGSVREVTAISKKASKYFFYDGSKNLSFCKIKDCKQSFKGNIIGNLKRHLMTLHEEESQAIGLEVREVCPKIKKEEFIRITMNKSLFLKACLKMVTVDGCPGTVLDNSGFTIIKRAICDSLKINVSSKIIPEIVASSVDQIKVLIAKEISGRMISLKLDLSKDRGVLGVTIEFAEENYLKMRMLGIIHLTDEHSSERLKDEILSLLQTYSIADTQIYSITCDDNYKEEEFPTANEDNKVMVKMEDYSEIEDSYIQSKFFIETTVAANDIAVNFNDIVGNACDKIPCHSRSAPHTFNICLKNHQEVLEHIRVNVVEAKSLKFKKLHTKNNICQPHLDCGKGWESTYTMLQHLHDNEVFYQELSSTNEDLNITQDLWHFIHNFTAAYKPVFLCDKKLREEQVVVGDFLKNWLEMKLELEELSDNTFAVELLQRIQTREEKLFDNNAYRAAIYLDPRYNFKFSHFLSDCDKLTAQEHLMTTWVALKEVKSCKEESSDDEHSMSSTSYQQETTPKRSKLEIFLDKKCGVEPQEISEVGDRRSKLQILQFQERLLSSAEVLTYWHSKRFEEPDLFKLSQVVLGAPATHVSAARMTNALDVFLTENSSLSLDNSIVIKLNEDLFEEIELSCANWQPE